MRGLLAKLLGNRGERLAARYLRRHGFRILARQYQTASGEIDLVALEGDVIVFIEVKTRRSVAAGVPAEAVTLDKQKRLTRMALAYLKRFKRLEQTARFDVVSIVWPENSRTPEIQHIRNAFPPVGDGQMFA